MLNDFPFGSSLVACFCFQSCNFLGLFLNQLNGGINPNVQDFGYAWLCLT